MTHNEKKYMIAFLAGILALIVITAAISYFIIKNNNDTTLVIPASTVTRPIPKNDTVQTNIKWASYDSLSIDSSGKDVRYNKDSMRPFERKDYTIKYPSNWYFTEIINSAEGITNTPITSFYDDKGDLQLSITEEGDPTDLSSLGAESVSYGDNLFYKFEKSGKTLYAYKTGTDDEIRLASAVQIVFAFNGDDQNIIKTTLGSFTLESNNSAPMTFNMANIDKNTNPCSGESEVLAQDKQDAIKKFYDELRTQKYTEALSALNDKSKGIFGQLFSGCSTAHANLAAVPAKNGIAIFSVSTNSGFPSVPNDIYYFGFIKASDNIIYLQESLIKNYFDTATAADYQKYRDSMYGSPDYNKANRILKNLEAKTKKEFLAGTFSNKDEQKEYTDFIAKYDSPVSDNSSSAAN